MICPIEIKAFYTTYDLTIDENFAFSGESHNFFEIICVLEGTVGIASEAEIYYVNEKNMVLHKPMEFHRMWSENNSTPRIIIISFDADIAPNISGTVFGLADDEIEALKKIYDRIRHNCEIIHRRVTRILPGREAGLMMAVNDLENLLLRVCSGKNGYCSAEHCGAECSKKYREIMKCLVDNVNSRLSLDDVAHSCGISTSSAKQIFHKYTGKSIMRYYRELKTKEAIALLKSGCSSKEIASRLGFRDQNYFSTFFKNMTGKSPRHYMSNGKGEDNDAGSFGDKASEETV